MNDDPREAEVRRGTGVLGDDAFRERLDAAQGRRVRRRRGQPTKERTAERISM